MKKLLTFIGIVFITIALLEGSAWLVLNLISDQPDPLKAETHIFDAHRNHRLNPAFQFSDDPKSRIHSSDGFRGNGVISIEKPEKTIRIVALGTSALYGAGAAAPYQVHRALFNDETVTGSLEKALESRLENDGIDFNIEVVNAGVSATKTFHHLMRLNDSILDFSPDIVINLDGHNDFYADRITDRWSGYPYSTNVLVDEFNGRTGFLPIFTTVRALSPFSSFFNLAEKALKRIWQSSKLIDNPLDHTPKYDFDVLTKHTPDIRETARRTYVRDLWQIHALGKYAGYEHCVFLQPEVVFEKSEDLVKSDRKIQSLTEKLQGVDAVRLMKRVRVELPSLFREAGIPYHDLGQIASNRTSGLPLYIDYCHLTPQGAATLAKNMADILFPMVIKRISQRLTRSGHSSQ